MAVTNKESAANISSSVSPNAEDGSFSFGTSHQQLQFSEGKTEANPSWIHKL